MGRSHQVKWMESCGCSPSGSSISGTRYACQDPLQDLDLVKDLVQDLALVQEQEMVPSLVGGPPDLFL